jgi:hypothetical protein
MLPFFQHFLTEYKMAVGSANLQSFDYDPEWEELTVTFRSGGVYRYDDVPEDVVDELKFAESRGRYFWRYIRQQYPFTILRHSRPGFVDAHNVAKTSTPQRHRLKTFASAPWKG